ncbi:flagellar motor switch protein FliM [Termitidicoccus mucosus]|uniref:Flagellar motor switch protein FliM n=1 Tax=Termitidicoccus mucosus TaxID=1184151 RepID=A0A178IHF1_9BACT|nr:flagellar motor switch protein FliM [Opitutaceae bacterium TSB47]
MAEDPHNGPIDALDQSEIDRLLAQTTEAEKPPVFCSDGRRAAPNAKFRIEAYDFRNPVFLTEVELRRLRLLHEDFIRYLSARLSLFLRMECGLKMARLTTLSYSKFTESLPSPTHICLFKAEPLRGIGVLDINPRLALTLVDRMLGGRGHSVKAERYLTEIEIALLEDIILIVLEEWCGQWKAEQSFRPQIVGHENNGRFLQTSPRDAIVLALALEMNFGDCAEQLQLGIPYYTIEPMVRSMQARRQREASSGGVAKKTEWKPACEDIAMDVRAQWNAWEMPLRELLSLRVGDVLELPAEILGDTRLLLENTEKFVGTVGIEGDHVAVKIKQPLFTSDTAEAPAYGRQDA